MCTTLPSLTGFSNEILSTDAVTAGALQCLCAVRAAAMSIQYMSRPPIKFPNTFVSLGKTNSVIMVTLSAGVLLSISRFFVKIGGNMYDDMKGSPAKVVPIGRPGQ